MMKKNSRFFIDLSARRVYCRNCGKKCHSLDLTDHTLFWCSTKSCGNDDEVRLHPGGIWEVYSVREALQENSISEITTRLVRSIGSRKGEH
ncbi:MAG: hypothetical protein MUF52_01520 [Syntrophobacteraceae bacterium]|nr:hypothetical protein [Syntrophobacteraceae bacterium]